MDVCAGANSHCALIPVYDMMMIMMIMMMMMIVIIMKIWPTWAVGVLLGVRDVKTYNRGRPS
jgi:hypothetical protein